MPSDLFRKTAAGASSALTTTSGRPSPSRSPTASPRPRIGRSNQRPGPAGDVLEPGAGVAKQSRTHRERHAEPSAVEDVAIGLDQVVPAVAVEIHHSEAESEDVACGGSQPDAIGHVAIRCRPDWPIAPNAIVERLKKLATTRSARPSLIEVARGHAHAGHKTAPGRRARRRRIRPISSNRRSPRLANSQHGVPSLAT